VGQSVDNEAADLTLRLKTFPSADDAPAF